MSLFSILNSTDSQSSSATGSTSSSALLQQIAALQSSSSTTSTTTSGSTLPDVVITMQAQQAAANAADAKADSAALAASLRKSFDAAKAAKKNPDVSALSGRSLSLVALNQNGTFSNAEVAQAKAQLRDRDRTSALTMIKSGALTATSLAAYSKSLLAARQSMSAEERQLRDGDPKLR